MSPIAFGPGYEGDSPLGLMLAEPLLEGVAGTEQTINVMRQLVDDALRDPAFIRKAVDLVRGTPDHDDFSKAHALWDWVHSSIRFVKDPVTKEKLYPPAELLKIRAGDCDDHSMLLGAFLLAVGIPARFVTVAAGADPEQFSHVYIEGQIDGEWIPMDTARPEAQFGVPPPFYTRMRWWSLYDSSHGDLSGTKIFADTVHVHGLGAYPRFRSIAGLGSYGSVDLGEAWDLGDLSDDAISSTGVAISDIIRASQGQQLSPAEAEAIAAAQGAPDPWASFRTTYTPGAGVPPGGYPAGPTISASGVPSWFWIVALGFGALALAGGRR